ncbi:MAG: RagB/SusD family nutrient uptake outer membrane protein [Gemmatimonadales bacterium]|nr:MAG: RagB/SusD family nutrient uptake outer membrane protein [Gemmatimonadales bacterium]
MKNRIQTRPRGGMNRVGQAFLALGVAVGLAACDSLLEVDNPGAVEAADLNNPALAATLLNSALGQFECAFTSYVASTSVLSAETINASSWLDINGWGWRGIELETITGGCPAGRNATGLGAYSPLQQARYLAEDATRLIEEFPAAQVPQKDQMLGLLAAYAGYSWALLGEGFCEMAVDTGPLKTRQEMFQGAEAHFDRAIQLAQAAGNDALQRMALVGRARVRLNQGNMDGAYADASGIPQGFAWHAEYSTVNGIRENRLFNMNRLNRFISVEPGAYFGLTVGGQPDTRVPVVNSGQNGHDGVTRHYFQNKYPTPATHIRMASWFEAQLIMAEARPTEAVSAINRLRAAQDLPAYTGTGSLEDVLEERRRQLFLEGHRLNDMLRHNIPFPSGVNHKDQPYGPITCMPLPEQERRNNPNIGS